jgi:AraC-like DNA-binding protein
MKQPVLLVICLCFAHFITAQHNKQKNTDSLQHKSYSYLDNKIYEYRKDTVKAVIYATAYLSKTKRENNWKEAVYAYQNLLHLSPDAKRIVYADSMIYAAQKAADSKSLGYAYLSKGIVYYGRKQYDAALEHYLKANGYILKSGDHYLTYKVKHQIAQIKFYLGYYDEAISLFRSCLLYFKSENPRAYLNTLHSLGVSYNRIGNYEMCSQTNATGRAESKRLNIKDMLPYFTNSDGINEYFKKNYQLALNQLTSSLDTIRPTNNFAIEAVGHFYIAKSYLALNKKEKALPYLLKVDQTLRDKHYLRPDLREVYELLISYYKGKSDLETQLYYINRLLKADEILTENYHYLIGKIHKEYDTKELLAEKEKINAQLEREQYYRILFYCAIAVLTMLLFCLTYRHFKNRQIYKGKFDALMLNFQEKNLSSSKSKEAKPLHIPEDTISSVLQQLEKFEKDKKFLQKDPRLATVATTLHTNTKYLSKIIAHYKGKPFVTYINDLKVDYLIGLLKEDRMVRHYTHAALAAEANFSSTQQFVHAFKARTEMPPSYFIEQIRKEQSSS